MNISGNETCCVPEPGAHFGWPAWWRAKIGSISPSLDLTSYYEQQTLFPDGVMLLQTRVMLKEATPEGLAKLGEEVLYGAQLLATVKPDVISYSCTSSAIMKGAEFEADIVRQIEETTGAKGTSMALSIREALSFLGVKKIAMVCPYLKAVVAAEEAYLEAFGFEGVYSDTLDKVDPLDYAARAPWDNYHFALDAARKAPEAEAVVVSCGAMRTIEIVEYLEKAIGKPAVSSNLCTAWNCLRLAGIKEPIRGYGTLLNRER